MFKLKQLIVINTFFIASLGSADPGFIHIENPYDLKNTLGETQNPSSLRNRIRQSVFRFIELSPVPLNPADYSRDLNKVSESLKASLLFNIAKAQLNECIEQNQEIDATCILPNMSSGTAFFAMDPTNPKQKLLWTVRHNLVAHYRSLKSNEKLNPKAKIYQGMKIGFLLVNNKGKIVFDTRKKTDQAQVQYLFDSQIVPKELTEGLRSPEEALDFVALKINGPLMNESLNLNFAKQIRLDDNFVIKAGYPAQTTTRFPTYNKNDSNGNDLYLSSGWTTSPAHAISYTMGSFHIGNYKDKQVFAHSTLDEWVENSKGLNDLYQKFYLNVGTEGIGSFSGSPVMNLNGEVLSIYTGSMGIDPDNIYRDYSGISIHSGWITKLIKTQSAKAKN